MSKNQRYSLVTGFLQQHKMLTAVTLLSLTINNLLNVLLPLSIGKFYEIVFHSEGAKGRILEWLPVHLTTTHSFLIFFGVLILLKVVLTFTQEYCIDISGERFAGILRVRAFKKQMRMPMSRFAQKPVGKHLARYSGELAAARQLLTKGILIFIGDLVFIIVTFSALFAVQPRLALVVLGIFGGGILLIRWLSRYLDRFAQSKSGSRSAYLDFVSSRLQAFYTVKSFNRETPEISRFEAINADLVQNAEKNFRFESFIQSLYPLVQYGALAAVLIAVAGGFVNLHPSDVFVFVLLLLYMRSVMRRLMQVNLVWRTGLNALNKWSKMLRQKSDEGKKGSLPEKVKGDIVFDKVSFTYEGPKTVFENLSFYIHPASITWLKGGRGSGKGTIFKLIQKIISPQSGEIRLDGHSYPELSAFDIRKNVTIVSPEAPLLGKTVFEAISYSANPEKREQAAAILEKLHLHLGAGTIPTLDFPLAEQGQNISAGERVLLQLARALLTKKAIILLNQPFGHFDTDTRNHVVFLLNHLKKKHTIIITGEAMPESLMIDQTIQLS